LADVDFSEIQDAPTQIISAKMIAALGTMPPLQFYSHAFSDDRMAAAGAMLGAILSSESEKSRLRAD